LFFHTNTDHQRFQERHFRPEYHSYLGRHANMSRTSGSTRALYFKNRHPLKWQEARTLHGSGERSKWESRQGCKGAGLRQLTQRGGAGQGPSRSTLRAGWVACRASDHPPAPWKSRTAGLGQLCRGSQQCHVWLLPQKRFQAQAALRGWLLQVKACG